MFLGLSALPAQAELFGPTPYATLADSPFSPTAAFSYFHLESFDQHELRTPGVTASAGATGVNSGFTGSILDQVGRPGGCPLGGRAVACDTWFSRQGPTGVSFSFDATVLGQLPNAVGIVWTDGEGTVTFEAFDQHGVSLGTVTGNHADGSSFGTTAEDRFYGVTHAGGISRIHISNSSGGIELDDLQYGLLLATPVANAGPDQTLPERADATLDGSASVGTTLRYAWTQVAGPSVELTGAAAVSPSFRAPLVPPGGATITFQLVVCESASSNCSEPDTVNVQVTNINQAPVAQAGPDQIVHEGSPVQVDGTASYDPDMESLTYRWAQVAGAAVTLDNPFAGTPMFTAPLVGPDGEQLEFELVVTDPHGLAHGDRITVTVSNVNQGPVADAGADQARNEQTVVTLDGSASADPDRDVLTYAWTQTGGPDVTLTGANTASPSFVAPAVPAGGALLTFELTVDDGQGGRAVDSVQIAVLDVNDPPVCALAHASPDLLWPPNHAMTEVAIVGLTDPNNETLAITYRLVTQDEPIDGVGDGDSSPDAVVSGNNILLRAERSGSDDGRVYVVHFTATDTQGGECRGTVEVTVPHSSGVPAIKGPQLYGSFLP